VRLARQFKIYLCAIGLLVAAMSFWMWRNRNTPAHEFERSLKAIYQSNFVNSGQVQARREARQLLNDVGTNGIPLLVQWLQWEPRNSPQLARMQNWEIFDDHPVIQNLLFGTENYRRANAAAWALELLGTNAAMAAPDLRKLTNGPEQTAYRAVECLRLVTGSSN
jgi:hypothetical protein